MAVYFKASSNTYWLTIDWSGCKLRCKQPFLSIESFHRFNTSAIGFSLYLAKEIASFRMGGISGNYKLLFSLIL